jgi:hypothetical protein
MSNVPLIPTEDEITREARELVQQATTFVMRASTRAKQLEILNEAVVEGARFRLEITLAPDATLIATAKTLAGEQTFFTITLHDAPPMLDA